MPKVLEIRPLALAVTKDVMESAVNSQSPGPVPACGTGLLRIRSSTVTLLLCWKPRRRPNQKRARGTLGIHLNGSRSDVPVMHGVKGRSTFYVSTGL